MGDWVGEGGGGPGQGNGKFSFSIDLQGAVLVRKNHAEYPATKDRAAYAHDDLMVVYLDSATKQKRAFYTDSERHVIQYAATLSSDGRTVIFLSDPQPGSPRYRLTYTESQPGHLRIAFEIASSDKPQQFERYIEAEAIRSTEFR